MRKIILAMHISLDGFIAGANGEMDWFDKNNTEIWNDLFDQLKSVDTLLLGRGTYPGFEHYWRSVPTNPASTKEEIQYSQFAEKAQKIVFSRTLTKVQWQNTTLVKEIIAEEIRKMKQRPGKDMIIIGGAGLASTFINFGLVDEYRLLVDPVVLGSGTPLFKNITNKQPLKLLKTKTYNSGVVAFYYQPI